MALFQELNEQGITIVLVTHDRISPNMRSGSSKCATDASCTPRSSAAGTLPDVAALAGFRMTPGRSI
jgi:hypothetical protein